MNQINTMKFKVGDLVVFVGKYDKFASTLVPGRKYVLGRRWDKNRWELRECNFLVTEKEIVLFEIYDSLLYQALREDEEEI